MTTETAKKDFNISLFHEEPKDNHAIGLPPEHYARIKSMIGKRRLGVVLKDRNNIATRFYMNNGEMFARQHIGDTVKTVPVFDISNLPKESTKYNDVKENVRAQIRKDFPDYTPDQVEAWADIIEEGSMAVRRLVSSGMSVKTAHNIVFSLLNKDNIDPAYVEKWLTENDSTNSMECPPPPTSP